MRISNGIKGNGIVSSTALSTDDLRRYAPSVFSSEKHSSRSDYFSPISTFEVLESLRDEGFKAYSAVQSMSKDSERRLCTKHMLRLRRDDFASSDTVNEIILLNANDGTSAYRLLAGKFRFVCQNGIVTGDIERDVRVHHNGSGIQGRVIEGVYEVVNHIQELEVYEDKMKSLMLTESQRFGLAMVSASLVYDDLTKMPYDPRKLLEHRRWEDSDKDMWSTFNVIQENLIKGGISGRNFDTGRKSTTRSITEVNKNLTVNRGLWTIARNFTDHTNVPELAEM